LKILVPIDFSPRCAWAARYSSRLAARLGSELLFVHVGASDDPSRLNSFLAKEIGPGKYRANVLCGDPASRIVEFARSEAADLIVMPTHAHGKYRRFLLGSVTAKVLHDADCPVWTGVHQESVPQSADAVFHNIICAVDLGPNSAALIRWARDLSEILAASLKVVHAIPSADETSDNRGEIELRRHLFSRAGEAYGRIRESSGLDVPITFAGGYVARVIREAVLRERAELVVIGRGHSQQALGRLRTCAYSVIRDSPCPVVSV